MLVLTRKLGEAIKIGDRIKVVVVSIDSGNVKLGVDAPSEVVVHREEVYNKIVSANVAASGQHDHEKAKALKGILASKSSLEKSKGVQSGRRGSPGKKNG